MYTIPWQLISPWHLGVPWVAAPDLWPPRAPPGNWGAAATGSDGGSMGWKHQTWKIMMKKVGLPQFWTLQVHKASVFRVCFIFNEDPLPQKRVPPSQFMGLCDDGLVGKISDGWNSGFILFFSGGSCRLFLKPILTDLIGYSMPRYPNHEQKKHIDHWLTSIPWILNINLLWVMLI